MVHGQVGHLEEQSGDTVHDGTDGSKVVQRDQRVHFVLGRTQETLHHDQAGGLEDDPSDLVQETNEDELDLTERGDNDTEDDDSNVGENLEVDGSHTHSPGGQQDGDGGGGLRISGCCQCREWYTP